MGDDLARARQFSDMCTGALSTLMDSEKMNRDAALSALENILSASKIMNARAISRTTRMAISDLSASVPTPQSMGNLLALNKLVSQYTTGLNEISDINDNEELEPNLPVKTYAVSPQETLEDLVRSQTAARETLAPIIHLAKTDDEKTALQSLLKLSVFQPNGDEQKFAQRFDEIMPAVTNESLRQARHSKKSVSVSYASDEIRIEKDILKTLQAAIISICEGLIARCIETPLRRQNQGLSSTAHIAITARRRVGFCDVIISCQGPTPSISILDEPEIAALAAFGITPEVKGENHVTRVEINSLPLSVSTQSNAHARHEQVKHIARPEMSA